MLLSGLMVTRPASLPTLPLAIGDFARQTLRDRELVIVHDGDARFDAELRALCAAHEVDTLIERVAPAQPLGALRNRSVELARGAIVAQWDDDDRHHPQRLALQLDAMRRQEAVAAFSTEQLHWFPARALMFWEDWQSDAWPLDAVQGTLIGVRAQLPRYPDAARGEDSALMIELARSGAPVARIKGIGWSYVYTFHGRNAWDAAHHAAAAASKALSPARLLAREFELRARLADYQPPLPPVRLPYAGGAIDIDAHAAPAGRNLRASHA
jgi:glycosyltransferase involved in cell wall biosynthesis